VKDEEAKQTFEKFREAQAAANIIEMKLLDEFVRYLVEEKGHTVEVGACPECGGYRLILMDVVRKDYPDNDPWDKSIQAQHELYEKYPFAEEFIEGVYPCDVREQA
jgi:hypothetical protein